MAKTGILRTSPILLFQALFIWAEHNEKGLFID